MVKARNFTFAIQKKEQYENIIAKLQNENGFDWAYIKHDKDENVDDHYHFYIGFVNGTRSTKSVADYFNIPEFMVCKVISKSGILSYLTHKNQPDKHRYNDDEVIANFDLNNGLDIDVIQEYNDFIGLKNGTTTPQEFLSTYKRKIVPLTLNNRLFLYKLVDQFSRVGAPFSSMDGGLSVHGRRAEKNNR